MGTPRPADVADLPESGEPGRGAWETLSGSLADDDAMVRHEAVLELKAFAEDRTVQLLVGVLRKDGSADVRKVAAHALGELRDPAGAVALLEALATSDEDPAVRGQCAEALGMIGGNEAEAALLTALEDGSAEVRFFAAFGLGLMGAVRALPRLRELAGADTGVAEGWGSVRDEARAAIRAIRAELGER